MNPHHDLEHMRVEILAFWFVMIMIALGTSFCFGIAYLVISG